MDDAKSGAAGSGDSSKFVSELDFCGRGAVIGERTDDGSPGIASDRSKDADGVAGPTGSFGEASPVCGATRDGSRGS